MTILKNVILDLGGVLLNIDYFKTENAFKQLGFEQFNTMYTQYTADKLFAELETGQISEVDFYEYMIRASGGKINSLQVEQAWNAMLLDFRLTSLDFLAELGARYQLFLLSNTNAIHKSAFMEMFTTQTGIQSFDQYFKKAYYSSEVGLRKPNEDIFQFVLDDANLLREETLFIDDSFNNIQTAEKMGFRTHLLLPNEKIEDIAYG
jgi:HAD superfamily hydrolase (TIGR01509 family)